MQCALALMASLRNTLPGQTTLIGGFCLSIVLTWTLEVWVLRRIGSSLAGLMKKVSCISLAGCSGGKFKAENTCQSSSISGPSATAKPNLEKMSRISSLTREIGCLVPSSKKSPGLVKSVLVSKSNTSSKDSLSDSIFSAALVLSSFRHLPNSLLSSGATVRNSSNRRVISPFFPRSFTLSSSTS